MLCSVRLESTAGGTLPLSVYSLGIQRIQGLRRVQPHGFCSVHYTTVQYSTQCVVQSIYRVLQCTPARGRLEAGLCVRLALSCERQSISTICVLREAVRGLELSPCEPPPSQSAVFSTRPHSVLRMSTSARTLHREAAMNAIMRRGCRRAATAMREAPCDVARSGESWKAAVLRNSRQSSGSRVKQPRYCWQRTWVNSVG